MFRPAQFLLHLLKATLRVRLRERPRHSRDQALDPLLDHVVGSAALQGFHGDFLAQYSGHEYEGNLRRQFPGNIQRRMAVKGGQGIIGQDDVPSLCGKRVHKLCPRLGIAELANQAGIGQQGPHQFAIAGVVFQMKDLDFSGHGCRRLLLLGSFCFLGWKRGGRTDRSHYQVPCLTYRP